MNDQQPQSSEPTHWVGVDVSKKTFDAALVRHGQKWPVPSLAEVPARCFPRTKTGIDEFLQWLDGLLQEDDQTMAVRMVMEATGRYSTELTVWVLEQRPTLAPAIAPPHQTASFIASLGLRNKTDKLEARALAFYGMERRPIAYEPLTPQEAELRDLVRFRDFLVRERTAAGNRAEESAVSKTVLHMQRKRLRHLDQDIERIENQMHRLLDQAPELKRDIDLLCSIYGVGLITAVTVRAELGDLRRFCKARQLAAYAGLNPSIRQSGTSVRRRPRMNKHGNSHVRQSLYLAAMVAVRGHSDLQRTYRLLCEEGKSCMAALGAIMRKLLILMRAILISGKPYEPLWKTRHHYALQIGKTP